MIKRILNNLSLFNKIKKFSKCLTQLISGDAIRFDLFCLGSAVTMMGFNVMKLISTSLRSPRRDST